jgi:hypothetical protein
MRVFFWGGEFCNLVMFFSESEKKEIVDFGGIFANF